MAVPSTGPSITIKTNAAEVRLDLRRLNGNLVPRAVASALNKTAFGLREAEGDETGQSFKFSGSQTESFLRKGFLYDRATPNRLHADFFPQRRTQMALEEHIPAGGSTIDADPRRLQLDGQDLLVPIPTGGATGPTRRQAPGMPAMKRTGRGKVPASYAPARLYATGRAFVIRPKSGRRILALRDKAKAGVKGAAREFTPLYVLVPTAHLKHRFDYFDRAKLSVSTSFPNNLRVSIATTVGRKAKASTRFM